MPNAVLEICVTAVVSEVELGWIVKCAKCRGTGVEPGYDSRSCSSCNGIGHRKLLLPDDADTHTKWGPVFCGHCQGRGIEPGYDSQSCQCCDGRGVQAGTFPRVICGKCKGRGIEPSYDSRVCSANGCSGRGSISIDLIR